MIDRALLFIALLLLLSTLVMPTIEQDRPVFSIQLSFDISQSMNVEDVSLNGARVSRLNFAKAAARSLLQSLPCGSRVGWSVFTGRRNITLVSPLDVCLHYSGLLASLETLDGRMRWANASSIGKGLHQAMRAAQLANDNLAVIYISDGHEAPPLRHGQKGIPDTSRFEIDGLVVGVGGESPARIPKTDAEERITGYWQAEDVVQLTDVSTTVQGGEELSRLYAEHLIKLAQLTGLNYVELDSVDAIANAVRAASFSQIKSTPVDLRWIPAALALLLLCMRFFPWNIQYRPESLSVRHR